MNVVDGHVVTYEGQAIPDEGITVTGVSGDLNLALRIWKAPGPKLFGFAHTPWIALFNQSARLE